MKINLTPKLSYKDVYITPKPSELKSRSEVNLEVSYIGKHSQSRITGIPVISANMTCISNIKLAEVLEKHRMFCALHKFINPDELINFFNNENSKYSFYTLGTKNEELEQLQYIRKHTQYLNKINFDIANGYIYHFLDKIKILRDLFPHCLILAGNVCTPEGVENIIKAGADIAKCGIGSGDKCTTFNKTGVGYRQFSVALECGQAANELNALCCADGGIKEIGDISKGLGAGSHFIMSGSLFGGYKGYSDDWIAKEDGEYQHVYGMSSKHANDKFCGGLKHYRAAEGKEEYVKYKGTIEDLIQDIKGGLASVCTYTNTKNLENLHKNCVFTI